MDLSSYSLPASLIRQYCFCPRIPYFNEIRGLNPADRPWLRQGVDYHMRQTMLNRRRKLQRFGVDKGELLHNVWLKGHTLPVHGVADALLITADEICPVEFKLNAKAVKRGQKLQMAAYGLLAEEKYNKPFRRGFILYGPRGQTLEVKADEKLRNTLTQTVDAIIEMLRVQLIPPSNAGAYQCGQCEYLNFCADRETDTE